MKSKYAPLILITYNRPTHTEKVLGSLNENLLASQTDLHIFSDAPKNEEAVEKVNAVRKVLHDFKEKDSRFKSVTIYESEKNLGCRDAVINAVSSVIDQYGKVILIEDDLMCRKNMLNYMNDALELYETNPKIWSISAHTRQFKELDNLSEYVYFTHRSCSSGWAIWKNRWDTIDWNVSDWPSIKTDLLKRIRLARGGSDLFKMLEMEMEEDLGGWDIRLQYAMSKTDMLTVYPRVSFTYNIGIDGSGLHKTSRTNEYYDDLEAIPYKLPSDVRFSKRINYAFLHQEYPTIYGKIIRKLKRILKNKNRNNQGEI